MRLRPISIAAVVVTAGATLVGCAPWYAVEGCTPTNEPGAASNAIAAAILQEDDDYSSLAPIAVDEPQESILGADGRTAEIGDVIRVDQTVIDGATGEVLSTTIGGEFEGQIMGRITDETGLTCVTPGSTNVLATPGESGTVIVITETHEVLDGQATGWPQPAVAGLPSIATAPDGTPGITWAGVEAPAEPIVSTTIGGDGQEVVAGDTLLLQYSVLDWDATTVAQSTWTASPMRVQLGGQPLATGQFDPSLLGASQPVQAALTGVQVGSQVAIALPAEQSITGGDAAQFVVIDVLDIVDVDG